VGLHVEVDRELCIGSGNCVYGAPGVFDLDDDEIAVVLDPDAASEDEVVSAARRCPSHAITVQRAGQSLL
jgi:ferredoxin